MNAGEARARALQDRTDENPLHRRDWLVEGVSETLSETTRRHEGEYQALAIEVGGEPNERQKVLMPHAGKNSQLLNQGGHPLRVWRVQFLHGEHFTIEDAFEDIAQATVPERRVLREFITRRP